LEQICRRTETTYRISIGTALKRLLACAPQVFDRLAEVVAATIVTRQVAQVIVQSLSEHRLQGFSGTLLQSLAALDQQRVVGHLLGQRMLEAVFNLADRRLFVDKASRSCS
jgi:hypothetical protein